MKVREKMNRKVYTVREDDDLALAVQMMAWASIHHLPVVREGRVVGVLSEHDVLAHLTETEGREGLQDPVGEAMSSPVQTAHPDDDYLEAVARISGERIGCLPVVAEGQLEGILTATDVVADMVRPELGMGAGREEGVLLRRVMTTEPLSVSSDEPLLDAVARMSQYRVRHLPVVDGEHRVIGIVADRDVRTAIGEARAASSEEEQPARLQAMKVGDVASWEVETLHEDEPLSRAIDLFLDRGYGAIPVVDESERLVGMLSYLDALRELSGRVSADQTRREEGEEAREDFEPAQT